MACEEIKARLDAAIAARTRLVSGAQVVVIVDAFRSRVEYTPMKLADLTAEIQKLTAEYNNCNNPGRTVALTRPVTFTF